MSQDQRVTSDIVETLKDGEKGYASAAERIAGDDPAIAEQLREFSRRRGAFASELEEMAAAYGDRIEEDGSMAAAVHRGWLTLKDAVSGDSAKAVLDACESGDDHAVSEYEKALDKDISPDLREALGRQLAEIRQTRETVSALSG